MNSITDTIAAVATPAGTGGVAIIRISGADSKEILSRVFSHTGEYEHAKMYFGKIYDGDTVLDEGYAVFFESPKSYTGENTAELHIHGSYIGALKIMDLLLKKGVRQAEPGEFSKRAFINGKIDLTKAQAIADYISSAGELCLKQSAAQMNGTLKRTVDACVYTLTDIIAKEEAAIEYPDEDIDDWGSGADSEEIYELSRTVKKLAETYKAGVHIKEGVKVAIIGKPNVGKSSVLNALCGRRRAIVSDIAGTTRDIISEKISIDGIVFELKDTAGIRQTSDIIENMGVEMSEEAVKEADLILFTLDCTRPIDESDLNALRAIKNSKNDCYIILNKIDCAERVLETDDVHNISDSKVIETSAFSDEHIEKLKAELKTYAVKDFNADGTIVINLRQAQLLNEAAELLNGAAVSAEQGLESDLILTDLKDALFALGEITGDTVSEEVVNRVFEKFCLGK